MIERLDGHALTDYSRDRDHGRTAASAASGDRDGGTCCEDVHSSRSAGTTSLASAHRVEPDGDAVDGTHRVRGPAGGWRPDSRSLRAPPRWPPSAARTSPPSRTSQASKLVAQVSSDRRPRHVTQGAIIAPAGRGLSCGVTQSPAAASVASQLGIACGPGTAAGDVTCLSFQRWNRPVR